MTSPQNTFTQRGTESTSVPAAIALMLSRKTTLVHINTSPGTTILLHPQAEAPCEGALKLAQVDASALKSVLVIGGCSRTPALQDLAARIFGKAGGGAGVISSPEQSDEMVVLGAALEARHLIYGD